MSAQEEGRSPSGRAVVNGAGQAVEWRPVMVHYEVSDQGQVRRGSRILKPTPRAGYERVCLSICNEKYYATVHRLVALAFLGPEPEGCQVAHLNGLRADNRLANLAYKTRAENEADKAIHGTSQHGDRNHEAKLRAADIPTVRQRLAAGEPYGAIAADYGVSPDAIRKIKAGRSWNHA